MRRCFSIRRWRKASISSDSCSKSHQASVLPALIHRTSHARKDLPSFAVPLFLRIVSEAAMNSTGVKQDKVQPRLEGVDPAKVRGDTLYVLRGDAYELFTGDNWDALATARARL